MKSPKATPISSARNNCRHAKFGERAGDDPAPEIPRSPSPNEVPPSAPPETPPSNPVEVPQPDVPPQPNSAPQPQAMTIYVRFMLRRKTWRIVLPKRIHFSPH